MSAHGLMDSPFRRLGDYPLAARRLFLGRPARGPVSPRKWSCGFAEQTFHLVPYKDDDPRTLHLEQDG
jgi:hypothetical protein